MLLLRSVLSADDRDAHRDASHWWHQSSKQLVTAATGKILQLLHKGPSTYSDCRETHKDVSHSWHQSSKQFVASALGLILQLLHKGSNAGSVHVETTLICCAIDSILSFRSRSDRLCMSCNSAHSECYILFLRCSNIHACSARDRRVTNAPELCWKTAQPWCKAALPLTVCHACHNGNATLSPHNSKVWANTALRISW